MAKALPVARRLLRQQGGQIRERLQVVVKRGDLVPLLDGGGGQVGVLAVPRIPLRARREGQSDQRTRGIENRELSSWRERA